MLPSHIPFENNLHHIIADFMEGDWDYWLSFDADNPPMRNPLDLVELDKDIIGCPTPVWHYDRKNIKKGERPIYYNGYKFVSDEEGYTEWADKKGLQKVDAIGTGCFLISRRVFENPEMRKAPFLRKTYPDGIVEKGNDISFCERAKENGFEIYMHYDYLCHHFCELDLNEIAEAFINLYEDK
jgi:GT2 family glycosyltransferase